MADNKRSLQLRMQTIDKVGKITNAMKLVSLSKLQRYRRDIEQYRRLYDYFNTIPSTEHLDETLPTLLICFAPDLGMVSQYNSVLQQAVHQFKPDAVYWIGHQGFERFVKSDQYKMINEVEISSDSFNATDFSFLLDELQHDYQIYIQQSIMNGETFEVSFIPFQRDLSFNDFAEYEPNFDEMNQRYRYIQSRIQVRQAYLDAKYTENFVRRIAMEKATDSANDMQTELEYRYHRLRQEEITQEILEISS